MIALALAVALGATPQDEVLRGDCDKPVVRKPHNVAHRPQPIKRLYRSEPKVEEHCESIIAPFVAELEPVSGEFSPIPLVEPIAAAQEPTIGREAGTEGSWVTGSSEVAGAAAFIPVSGSFVPELGRFVPIPAVPEPPIWLLLGLILPSALGWAVRRPADGDRE